MTWRQQADTTAVMWAYGYDAADQLAWAVEKTTDAVPTILKTYMYAYDPAGNRTSEQIDDQLTGATYDGLNRLVSQQPAGAMAVEGTVNEPAEVTVQGKRAVVMADGRFTTTTPVIAGTTTLAVTATDPTGNTATRQYEVDSAGAGQTFTYDANGNLTGDGTRSLEWDVRNQLVAVTIGTSRAEFAYDWRGRRVQKVAGGVTHNYVFDGIHIAEERLSSGGTIRSFHGYGTDDWLGQQSAAGSFIYLVADHLGSIVNETNLSGQVTLTRQYDPWGNLDATSSAFSGHAFAGREWDADAQLYGYRTRQYDSRIGRFISDDSIGLRGGMNLYVYVDDNPTNKNDPLGLRGWRIEWKTCVGAIMQETRKNHCGNGKNVNDPSCGVAHCVANCKITRECIGGRVQAAIASYVKEGWDEFKEHTYDPDGVGYDPRDQQANKCGRVFAKKFPERSCEQLCKDVR